MARTIPETPFGTEKQFKAAYYNKLEQNLLELVREIASVRKPKKDLIKAS